MLHKTIGSYIYLEETKDGFLVGYDTDPDRDHGNIKSCNPKYYPIVEKEVRDIDVFTAYVNYYGIPVAYKKLKEIGMIK